MVSGPLVTGMRFVDAALVAYARGFEHPGKIRVLRSLARRFAGDRILVRHAARTVIAIDPGDYIGWAVLRTGSYEPASLALALRLLSDSGGLFLDIGANFGWYSCAVAALAGTRVIAIEPDCGNCTELRRNVARNDLANVTLVNTAVGARFGVAAMTRRASGNSGTVALSPDPAQSGAGDCTVTLPLASLLRQLVVPPVRPALLKLDVEGGERDVLAGLDLGGPFRPRNIIMEFEPSFGTWESAAALQQFFAAHGYQVTDVLGAALSDAAAPIENNVWAQDCDA